MTKVKGINVELDICAFGGVPQRAHLLSRCIRAQSHLHHDAHSILLIEEAKHSYHLPL